MLNSLDYFRIYKSLLRLRMFNVGSFSYVDSCNPLLQKTRLHKPDVEPVHHFRLGLYENLSNQTDSVTSSLLSTPVTLWLHRNFPLNRYTLGLGSLSAVGVFSPQEEIHSWALDSNDLNGFPEFSLVSCEDLVMPVTMQS